MPSQIVAKVQRADGGAGGRPWNSSRAVDVTSAARLAPTSSLTWPRGAAIKDRGSGGGADQHKSSIEGAAVRSRHLVGCR